MISSIYHGMKNTFILIKIIALVFLFYFALSKMAPILQSLPLQNENTKLVSDFIILLHAKMEPFMSVLFDSIIGIIRFLTQLMQ